MPFLRLYYHIVWATAGRQPIIHPHIEYQVHESIKDKIRALGGEVFAVNSALDHVHIAATIPPTISISKFIGAIKGASAFHINHLPDNPHTIDWQRGYGILSLRRSNLEQIKEYIKRQKEHHALGKLWPSLEDCDEANAPADIETQSIE